MRRFWIALIIVIITGCQSPKKAPETEPVIAEPQPTSIEEVRPVWENAIEQSMTWFDEGMSLIHEDYGAALDYFDLAVLEILDCRSGLAEAGELRRHLDELITWIHEAEREMARQGNIEESSYGDATLTRLLDDIPLDFENLDGVDTTLSSVSYDMPVEQNQVVLRFIDIFTTTKADIIGGSLERSTRYLPMIRRVFAEEGLPMDLSYLPVIESGFKHGARSRARAVGIWQFVAYVGRHYGLTIDWYEDQRRDPEAATRAAARYFKELYEQMGDWNLALCAYNYGPGRVARAVRRGGTRDFWHLSRQRLLPRETRGYVPAFMAAVAIARSPEAYGFANLEYQLPPRYEEVPVDFSLSLEDLAKGIDLDPDTLYELNPALIRRVTPGNRVYQVRVPLGMAERSAEVITAIPPEKRNRLHRYTMRRGDTLSGLAARFDTSVEALMLANEIRNPRRLRAGKTLLIPLGNSSVSPPAPEPDEESTRLDVRELDYTIRRGDTLYHIAKRLQTTIPSLIALNPELDPLSLKPGQTIKAVQGNRWSDAKKVPVRSLGYTLYRVQKGDTVSAIARRFRTSTDYLQRYNNLGPSARIGIGQMLKIPNAEKERSRVISYRVKRGDTLSRIARRFRTSVAKIKEWNRLGKDTIVVGQTLVIYQ